MAAALPIVGKALLGTVVSSVVGSVFAPDAPAAPQLPAPAAPDTSDTSDIESEQAEMQRSRRRRLQMSRPSLTSELDVPTRKPTLLGG